MRGKYCEVNVKRHLHCRGVHCRQTAKRHGTGEGENLRKLRVGDQRWNDEERRGRASGNTPFNCRMQLLHCEVERLERLPPVANRRVLHCNEQFVGWLMVPFESLDTH